MIWYERTVHIGGILTQIIVVVVIIIIIIIIIINIIIIIIIIIDDKVKRLGAIALSYPPFFGALFFIGDSGAEFHADEESYRNLGLKMNRNKVIHLQSSPKSWSHHMKKRHGLNTLITKLKNKQTKK